MVYTISTTNLNPDITNISAGNIYAVGSGSSADVYIEGIGDYIYYGVWDANAGGRPDSWAIIDRSNGMVVKNSNNYFITTVSGGSEGIIVTVGDNSGRKTLWTILIILLVIIVLALLIVFGIYGYKKWWSKPNAISIKPQKPVFTL